MPALPSSVENYSAPDADISATIQKIRQALYVSGNRDWRKMTNKEIIENYMPMVAIPQVVSQPKAQPVREVDLDELKNIIITRGRFPNYRSDVKIPDSVKQAVVDQVKNRMVKKSIHNYGNQPFTIVPTYSGVENPISDDLAFTAIARSETVAPFTVTDFTPTNKTPNPMNKRYNERHPVVFGSLVEPVTFSAFAEVAVACQNLDCFDAFADETSDMTGETTPSGPVTSSTNWGGLVGTLASTGANIYGSVSGSKTARAIRDAANANAAAAAANASGRVAKPMNWTPILIGGGVLLLVGVVLLAKK